jgi:hypothetical protein
MHERLAPQEQARAEHELKRAMVDAVMRAIIAEDRLQSELKRRKQAKTVKVINALLLTNGYSPVKKVTNMWWRCAGADA